MILGLLWVIRVDIRSIWARTGPEEHVLSITYQNVVHGGPKKGGGKEKRRKKKRRGGIGGLNLVSPNRNPSN